MPDSICRVSFRDTEGIEHAVEVTASSLYEAAVLGLVAFRRARLADVTTGPVTELEVTVRPPAESHRVRVGQVQAWLNRVGRGPAERVRILRLKEMLSDCDGG